VYRPGDEGRVRGTAREKKVTADDKPTAPAPVPIAWTGWRGPRRDGRVGWLPEKLPAKITPVWSLDTTTRGLGGVAATSDLVLYSDRVLNDSIDEWKCVSAADGKEKWTYSYPCKGNLDYGNSPRATPLLDGDHVYLFGAFGHLACLKLKSGEAVWELNLRDEFEATDEPKWGACSNPLLVDGKLIVNPGTKDASLAALDPKTGKVLWKTPGKPAGYGSLIAGKFGGTQQIVGHDADSLGGWDVATGKRLWTVRPDVPNDFNVPTPIDLGGKLLVTTENNGTRVCGFKENGVIDPKPAAVNKKLAPDTHTPVVVGDRVFGIWRRLFCLSVKNGLKPVWDADGQAFTKYAAVVATDQRVLVMTLEADFILFDATADEFRELSRVKVLPDEKGLYSHPAFVGKRVYVRGSSTVVAIELG
jgi:outer membrane protein assembly factor BamB